MCGARVYGFGYDFAHNDYKLVRISQFVDLESEGFALEVKVFVNCLCPSVWKIRGFKLRLGL